MINSGRISNDNIQEEIAIGIIWSDLKSHCGHQPLTIEGYFQKLNRFTEVKNGNGCQTAVLCSWNMVNPENSFCQPLAEKIVNSTYRCPVEIFDAFPYPEEVSPKDRARLASDPSAGGMSGKEGGAISFPFPIFNLFYGPQSDKLLSDDYPESTYADNLCAMNCGHIIFYRHPQPRK